MHTSALMTTMKKKKKKMKKKRRDIPDIGCLSDKKLDGSAPGVSDIKRGMAMRARGGWQSGWAWAETGEDIGLLFLPDVNVKGGEVLSAPRSSGRHVFHCPEPIGSRTTLLLGPVLFSFLVAIAVKTLLKKSSSGLCEIFFRGRDSR